MSEALTNPAFNDASWSRRLPVSSGVAVSLAAHAVAIGAFFVVSLLEPPRLAIEQKPISAKLIRLGQKRDERLLPRKDVAAPPPPARRPVEVASPVTRPAPARASEPTHASAQDTERSRSRLFEAFSKTAAKPEEKSGDPGGDPDGDSDTAEAGERYFGLILAKARRNYGITKTIAPGELIRLKATVVLYISTKGELLKDPVIQSGSGNDQFDSDVVLSLRKAAPFGPPPEHLVKTLKTVGVAVECTP